MSQRKTTDHLGRRRKGGVQEARAGLEQDERAGTGEGHTTRSMEMLMDIPILENVLFIFSSKF